MTQTEALKLMKGDMIMKKKLCVLLLGLCLFSLSACGSKEVSNNHNDTPVSSQKETEESEEAAEEKNTAKTKIDIKDIAWDVDEGIVDGKRCVLLNYTNNSSYTITGFEITFKEKSDIMEEDKQTFYSDIQEMFEASDEEIEELKEYPISMYAKTAKIIDSGESATNVNCHYYTGYYYLEDINHYLLVEPDIATIKYIDEDNIHTVYYDYNSGKYSAESETIAAYQWPQTDLGNKIPKPDVKVVQSSLDTEELYMFDAYGMSLEQFNSYVEECKGMGYTVDPSGYEGFYSAHDSTGYNIYLSYEEEDNALSCHVEAPYDEYENVSDKEGSDKAASEDAENTDGNTDTDTNNEPSDNIRPEFKEAMDSYEAFYDEYCDVMKKYKENPTDTEILDDYLDMLEKGNEMSEKFAEWENGDMNDAELKYYLDVYNRVNKKLIDVLE